MKNFIQLPIRVSGNSVAPLLLALHNNPLWGLSDFDKLRTEHPQTPHNEVESITLRNNAYPYMDGMETNWQIDSALLSQLFHNIIFDTARSIMATQIGRIIITKLSPGGEIPPHIDQGEYVKAFDRFHIPLQEGGIFYCGDEEVRMKGGEVWWMNNKIEHSVFNDTEQDRIHLIIDLKRT